jgi:toxin HigB-1
VIKGWRHKGLRAFFETGKTSGIRPEHSNRLRLLLARLNASAEPRDMSLPGLRLHQLKGRLKGNWAVDVSGSWRVVFRFEGKDVFDVDYLDYH